jgi:hypothetical protein
MVREHVKPYSLPFDGCCVFQVDFVSMASNTAFIATFHGQARAVRVLTELGGGGAAVLCSQLARLVVNPFNITNSLYKKGRMHM